MATKVRDLRFIREPGVGGPGKWGRGSLTEMLLCVPYFFDQPTHNGAREEPAFPQAIPPRSLINHVLASGKVDAGMSGGVRWKPFQIEAEEYAALVDELLALPGYSFELTDDSYSELDMNGWLQVKIRRSRELRELFGDDLGR